MRNFQQCTSNNKNQTNTSSSPKGTSNEKPHWMKRLQEKKKEAAHHQTTKNIDFDLFPSMNESIGEITYLDDEDDLAASFFPECNKMGSSMTTIDSDDLPVVSTSVYNFA